MIEMLLESPLEEWQASDLRDAGECAREMVDLINRVLDLAKLQAGPLQLEGLPLCLPRVAQHAVALAAQDPCARGLQAHAASNTLVGDVTFHVWCAAPPLQQGPHATSSQPTTPCLTTSRPTTPPPTTSRPTTPCLTTSRPTTPPPTTSRPTTPCLTTSRPTTPPPTTSRPTTPCLTTSRPTTPPPTTSRPTTPCLTTSRPTTPPPTTSRPTTPCLTTSRPTTPPPTTSRPTTPCLTTSRPTTPPPTTSRPTTPCLTTSRPTIPPPTTSRPTTPQSSSSRPATPRFQCSSTPLSSLPPKPTSWQPPPALKISQAPQNSRTHLTPPASPAPQTPRTPPFSPAPAALHSSRSPPVARTPPLSPAPAALHAPTAWQQQAACVRSFPPDTRLVCTLQHLSAPLGSLSAQAEIQGERLLAGLGGLGGAGWLAALGLSKEWGGGRGGRETCVGEQQNTGVESGGDGQVESGEGGRLEREVTAWVEGVCRARGAEASCVGERQNTGVGSGEGGRLEREVAAWLEGACKARGEGEWMVVMACEDTGGGIPPEEMRWVLDPYGGDPHHSTCSPAAADDAADDTDGVNGADSGGKRSNSKKQRRVAVSEAIPECIRAYVRA
ncbi:unnamed protein product [Closterium sp. NIES-64]|nr:unnamed protein product [Closterium sp. NIES-64]CAI5998884.1 unnamed protein product [Closterium sp. NIES-64]